VGKPPFKYLGCTIFKGRVKIEYFLDIVGQVESAVAVWKGKLLSYGGRITLLRSTLLTIPIYYLAAMSFPKTIIIKIESICCDFLWGNSEDGKAYHWVRWKDCCKPTLEGGIGLRKLDDISEALSHKLWWNI
jgi:hypothetical protein